MKIFRNIRHKLASENLPAGQAGKVSTYLRYAIGEIILVVIGILIALQINNWKQKSENLETEKFYLNSLLDNLNEDEKEIAIIIDSQDATKNIRKSLYDLLRPKEVDKSKIDSTFALFSGMNRTFFPNTAAFNSLKMSGNFGKIKNKALQLRLSNLYEIIYNRINYNGEFYDRRVENASDKLTNYYDWDKMRFTKWDIVTNGKLKNMVAFNQEFTNHYINLLNETLENIKHTKELIESEIIRINKK
ncbi:MAG: DUF6090 family protein [Gelidibacter sp.]